MTAILVVGMIIVLLLADLVVVAHRRRRGLAADGTPAAPPAMTPPRPPHGLFLDPMHSWVRLQSDGSLRVGIDDLLAEALGSADSVELPERGRRVERGEPMLALRVGSRRVTVRAPISGEVVAVNHAAVASPTTVSADPYGLGWLIAVWPRDHKQAIEPLLLGSGVAAFLQKELARLVELLGHASGTADAAPVMADGGLPVRGVLARLDDVDLDRFEREFLGGRSRASKE
jgi:glycine cleavage system H lipoate-binding protein